MYFAFVLLEMLKIQYYIVFLTFPKVQMLSTSETLFSERGYQTPFVHHIEYIHYLNRVWINIKISIRDLEFIH